MSVKKLKYYWEYILDVIEEAKCGEGIFITCSAVAQHCVKAHMQTAKSMEKAKIRPTVKSELLKLSP